jgi:hypothetical protein
MRQLPVRSVHAEIVPKAAVPRMMKALPVPPIDGILIRELQVYLDGRLSVMMQRFPS